MKKEKNILVIENREFWKDKIKEVLDNGGYKVIATTDPQEGINLASKRRFDLILLDYSLRGVKSLDVLRKIRINNKNNKVVITTTHPTVSDAVKYLRFGAFDYIEKPYNFEEIKTIVECELAGKQYPVTK